MSDRPPLHPTVWEMIELAAKRVDADYWESLKAFQIHHSGPRTLSPAKTPQMLLNMLDGYASALYRVEEDQYSKTNSQRPVWLLRLAERIVERILRAVQEIEDAGSKGKLAYHGVSLDEIRVELIGFMASITHSRVEDLTTRVEIPHPPQPSNPSALVQPAITLLGVSAIRNTPPGLRNSVDRTKGMVALGFGDTCRPCASHGPRLPPRNEKSVPLD